MERNSVRASCWVIVLPPCVPLVGSRCGTQRAPVRSDRSPDERSSGDPRPRSRRLSGYVEICSSGTSRRCSSSRNHGRSAASGTPCRRRPDSACRWPSAWRPSTSTTPSAKAIVTEPTADRQPSRAAEALQVGERASAAVKWSSYGDTDKGRAHWRFGAPRLCAVLALVSARQPAPSGQNQPERDFLSRIRRLTIEGRRAGEGYWSKDGQQLVFQSEREPGNPVLSDLHDGPGDRERERVSPGTGKTTCSFINPETGDILFASTHHDPRSKQLQDDELQFRASGQERRYSWDYDPEMELYVRSAQNGHAVAADERARLRRRSQLLTRRPVDRLLVDPRGLRSRAVRRRTEATRDGPELLRRDLHHAADADGPA